MPNPGLFHRSRYEYLTSFEEEFVQLRRKGDTQRGEIQAFFRRVTSGYWKRFHWKLSLHEDPPVEPNLDEEEVEPSPDAGEVLTEDELKEKEEYIQRFNGSIVNWFYRRQSAIKRKERPNPWKPLFDALLRSTKKKPARQPAWKVFMSDNGDLFKDRFTYLKNTEGKPTKMEASQRCAAAKDYYGNLPPGVKEMFEAQATEQHREALRRYEEPAFASTDPLDQAEAIRTLSNVAKPMLDAIYEFTGGLNVTLLAGRGPQEPGGAFILSSIHSGKTFGENPQQWDEHDPDGFRKATFYFAKFLVATSRE
ncbi:hypothetical protein BD410DRAFT_846958 [Rickenella mellea]|uniref:Uncharacterized protein n=1 Tax=Rickenella mellea TaxID=50990 RepID=A0A4Y7PDR7_9AGAM|nr:hypothetical protein BD410DRAFT_846958 [Rickenella mellea]